MGTGYSKWKNCQLKGGSSNYFSVRISHCHKLSKGATSGKRLFLLDINLTQLQPHPQLIQRHYRLWLGVNMAYPLTIILLG
jgi:hypothetical protein